MTRAAPLLGFLALLVGENGDLVDMVAIFVVR
jgi:hypothetical protein